MREFTAIDLADRTGDVLAVAAQEPVRIALRDEPGFVLLSIEAYARLRGLAGSRRAIHVSDLSDAEAQNLIDALETSIADE